MPFSKKLSSLHRLAIVERALSAGVVEIPADGGEWTVSPGAQILLAINGDGQAGMGRVVADLIHADDRLAFFTAINLMLAGVVPPSRTYRIRTAGGQVRYIAFRFDVLAGESGRAQRFVAVLRDITAEEIADRVQNKIGRLLDTLMSGMDVGVVWRIDAAGRILDHFAQGVLARTVQPSAHEWHRFVTEESARLIQEKLRTGFPFSVQIDVLCEDGVIRRCVNRGFPLKDESGCVAQWCGVINEVRSDASPGERTYDLAAVNERMTGAIVRAGCGLLDWTHEDLARRSGLSPVTVRRMASSPDRLLGLFRRATVEAALNAFVAAGLDVSVSDDRKVLIGR